MTEIEIKISGHYQNPTKFMLFEMKSRINGDFIEELRF